MAVLSAQDRFDTWSKFMQELSTNRSSCALNKNEIRAAIDAADDWEDTSAAGFDLALPPRARALLTAKQKAWLRMLVVRRRFEVT